MKSFKINKYGTFLKNVFPRPRIPQIRYLILGAIIIYYAFNIYGTKTSDQTKDDSCQFFLDKSDLIPADTEQN